MKGGEAQKKKKKIFFFFLFFFCKIGNFLSGIGKKTYFLALGMGLKLPQNRVIESPADCRVCDASIHSQVINRLVGLYDAFLLNYEGHPISSDNGLISQKLLL